MERDFVEMSSELDAAGVEYLVVSARAMAAHRVPGATGRPKDLLDAATLEVFGRHG
jgi:hypothetical protein